MNTTAVNIYFVRHGESTDNLRSVWAGWQDAPLSNHGMNQAKALGLSLADIPFSCIYASNLKRAHTTALALTSSQSQQPLPPCITSPLIREQYFGIAEGKPWTMHVDPNISLTQHYAEGKFTVLSGRAEKFPGGESIDDLAERASQAIEELVMPKVWKAVKEGKKGVNVAVVSHGLCISELIPALLKKGSNPLSGMDYRGLVNTAWTRLTIDVEGAKGGETLEFTDDNPPPLVVRVTDVNRHEHIDQIKRQKGGIGSAAYDPNQKDIRAFFGGGAVETPVVAMDHGESNVGEYLQQEEEK